MASVLDPGEINGLTLKNRFVCSAIWNGMANADGSASQAMIDVVAGLAQGHVGLIISSATFVSRDGHAYVGQGGVHSDELLPGLTAMARAAHEAGGKIALQLYHGGLYANPEYTGQDPLGPSVLSTKDGPLGRELTTEQIRGIVAAFREGAVRAVRAGFDGVQIHAAHGYLPSQFLSPFFNRRTDGYGGSVENRARMLLEIVESVRDAVGDQFLLMAKINSEDFLAGGLSVDDMLQVAGLLERAGVDAIELSGGTIGALMAGNPDASFSRTERNGPYYEEAAKRFRKLISVPLILVGGIRSLAEAQRLVGEGITDYVSLARPLIMEPALVQRWEAGDTRPSACLSDNSCLVEGLQGKGVHCIHTYLVPQAAEAGRAQAE